MSVSLPWNKTQSSDAKLNRMTIPTDTGTNLAAYDKTKFKIVACSATGGGLTLDHIYIASEDGTQWIDIQDLIQHNHTSTSTGGKITEIYARNPERIDLLFIKSTDLVADAWNQTITSTGTVEDGSASNVNNVRLRPNATSGSGSTISYGCPVNASFIDTMVFVSLHTYVNTTSLATHWGVNADDVTAADSNSVKIQAEVCTATNNNFWLRTANGSAHSASDLGVAITTNKDCIHIEHRPTDGTPNDIMMINDANALTKTTHIATTGASTTGNLYKVSQKNSTAADREVKYHGGKLSFLTQSTWAYG